VRRASGAARHVREPRRGRGRLAGRDGGADGPRDRQGSPAAGSPRDRRHVRGGRGIALAAAVGHGGAAARQRRARLVATAMSDESDVYLPLLSIFALCSVIAVGGATSAVPEMHRQVVDIHHWISDRSFTELFAIAQASPGPNVVFVTLLGQYVGGGSGGPVAMFRLWGPALPHPHSAPPGVAPFQPRPPRVVDRFKQAPWRIVLQAGLVPVTIGLIASSALIVARAADRDIPTLLITAASFALCYWTRVTPLLALALAGALGLTGLF